MHKVTWVVRFAAGVQDGRARDHWEAKHAELLLSLPGVERATQNTVVPPESESDAASPGFSGYSCAWWSGEDAFREAVQSAEWKRFCDDVTSLTAPDWPIGRTGVEISEHVMRQGLGADGGASFVPRPGTTKLVGILKFKPGMDPDAARAYWLETHAQFALNVAELGHYVQNHVMAAVGCDGPEAGRPAFDGFSEAYFEDHDAYEAGAGSQEWQGLSADAPNLLDTFRMSALVAERVLKG